ncbi:MAG: 5-bromo-4-chloroindolyl phosphate hydrolysis family protein [Schwartzia sp.]|nr:5-bromo-4-chloroindolyl phosphate hydrolysis family protein [Schwartzia sp. (in: firmicutes)]
MKNSHLYFIAAVIAFAIGAANWSTASPVLSVGMWFLTAALGGLGFYSMGQKKVEGELSLKMPDHAPQGFLPESFLKAVDDFNFIQEAMPGIKDSELRAQLDELQHTSRNMLTYLEKYPEKLPLARRFIDYYQDRTVELVKKYQDFAATGLSTPDVLTAIDRIKKGLADFRYAYEDQFSRLMSDSFIDLDVELKVAEQEMSFDGIEKKSHENVPDYRAAVGERTGLYFTERSGERKGRSGFRGEEKKSKRNGSGEEKFTFGTWTSYIKEKGELIMEKFMGRGAAMPVMDTLPSYVISDLRHQKLIAGLLGIFFGSIGAHKFYFGKTKWGILYAAFFWTSIPGFIGFVEGMRYLLMPLDDFYVQYYDKKDSF